MPQLLDMTVNGRFVESTPRGVWPLRLGIAAALVAFAASALLMAAALLWVVAMLLPVALAAGAVAYAAFRYQVWRARRRMGT